MGPKPKIIKESQVSRRRQKRQKVRRCCDTAGLTYERFEPRFLLAAIGELSPVQEQLIFDYIAATPETAYLQQGANDLEFVAGDSEGQATTPGRSHSAQSRIRASNPRRLGGRESPIPRKS